MRATQSLSLCSLLPPSPSLNTLHQSSSPSMIILTSPFPIFAPHSKSLPFPLKFCNPRTNSHHCKVSITPPPPNFDFKTEFFSSSREAIEENHPELLDLADSGTLFLIKKSQYGPVPSWRTEFVEPEYIWLIGTNHLSLESAMDVQRVIRAIRPENVVVELCRSRAAAMTREKGGALLHMKLAYNRLAPVFLFFAPLDRLFLHMSPLSSGMLSKELSMSNNSTRARSFRKIIQVQPQPQRKEEKWWLPVVCVPAGGISEKARKHLRHKRDCANQIHKAAMAINSSILAEMEPRIMHGISP